MLLPNFNWPSHVRTGKLYFKISLMLFQFKYVTMELGTYFRYKVTCAELSTLHEGVPEEEANKHVKIL
jgi:hypothetical protein